MKKLLLVLILAVFTNGYSVDTWVSTGNMSQSNNDWVYAMSTSPSGEMFASSWAVGIYKGSTAGNTSWSFSGLSGKRVSNLFHAPNGDIYGYSHTTSIAYIHRSTDNGVTWTDVYTRSLPNNYAGGGGMVFPQDGSILAAFAYTQGPTVGNVSTLVLRSTDEGNTWAQLANLTAGFVGGMQLLDDGRIWLGTSLSGVAQSTNNGVNWAIMTSFPPIFIDNIHQDNSNNLYVCDAYGFNRSTDNGQTFVALGPSVEGYTINASFVDSKGRLYVAYNNEHSYRSTNHGETWELLTAGFPSTAYICSYTEANGKIYAGTRSNGTYVLTDGVTNISNGVQPAKGFALKQNYPNPFNPSTKISFSVSKSSFVSLNVFDASGKKVASLINDFKNAGEYNINFEAANLSGGVYFYKLQAEGFSETKRMILVK